MRVGRRRRRFLLASVGVLGVSLLPAAQAGASLPDGRAWEMVSPAEKNGGWVDPPQTIAGGGVLQAAAGGGAVTFSSSASFAGGLGAPPASQYLSTRTPSGWATENLTVPIFSGSYDFADRGVPYQLFAPDLARALLLNGDRCRGEASECPVANPPLAGTDAPAGYQDYYLRENGSFEALIGAADVAGRGLDPATFEVRLEGAAPDLSAVVLASCSPLSEGAIDGCATGASHLYLWRRATGALSLLATPGSRLAGSPGAVSPGGDRVYAYQLEDGPLSLYEEGQPPKALPKTIGSPASLQATSSDGQLAFYTVGTTLYRYSAATEASTQLASGVKGVLGASADGGAVYFQDASGLQLWQEGAMSTVAGGAAAADPSTYPPATGAARVSEDGTKLLFVSKAKLSGYDNTDKFTKQPDSEVFLYDASSSTLTCVSCNIASKRPIGPATIPGAIANGSAPGSTQAYKPRALSADGKRVFFDSADALLAADSNSNPTTGAGVPDVYQWEAQGEGSCQLSGGCVSILSNGAMPDGASFADASSDGSDAYFLTEASLVGTDTGAGDLYDARVGGGFAEPPPQIPCEGDACQILPSPPSDPALATLVPGLGNPAVTYRKYCRRGYVKRKGICVKKRTGRRHHKRRRGGR